MDGSELRPVLLPSIYRAKNKSKNSAKDVTVILAEMANWS